MKFNYITIFLIVFPAIVISKMETFCCVCKSSKSKTGSCATSGFNYVTKKVIILLEEIFVTIAHTVEYGDVIFLNYINHI